MPDTSPPLGSPSPPATPLRSLARALAGDTTLDALASDLGLEIREGRGLLDAARNALSQALERRQPRPQRESSDLDASLRHLWYEARMFRVLADPALLRTEEGQLVLGLARLEALVLHARNLHAFLHDKRALHDDMMAEDFVGREAAWALPPSPTMDALRDRVNKLLAHLSYSRETLLAEHPDWRTDDIARELNRAFEAFVAVLRESGGVEVANHLLRPFDAPRRSAPGVPPEVTNTTLSFPTGPLNMTNTLTIPSWLRGRRRGPGEPTEPPDGPSPSSP